MKNIWSLFFALSLVGARGLHAQAPAAPAAREIADLAYVKDGHERQRLDLYLPPAVTTGASAAPKLRPVVAWVHGGAWEVGGKRPCPAKGLAQRGYVVASIGYRLSSQAIFPAQIEDCKAAIRWLRAHAGEYGIDPERIGVWGESAGGHLVTLLGTTGATRQFDVGENLDQPSRVQCVVDWFGPSDFLNWGDPAKSAAFAVQTDTPVARLLGGTIAARHDLARAASPLYDVDKNSAPFLIMHGDQDPTVPVQQSETLEAAFRRAGADSTLKILAGAGHGGPLFSRPESVRLATDFLDRHLHPALPPAAAAR